MTRLESKNAITTAYPILHTEIEDERDLKKYKLSLSDYYAACTVMEELREPGSTAKCFIKSVADFFHNCGYDVTSDGVNYIISC